MKRRLNIAPNRSAIHPFDLRHQTDTAGYIHPQDLRSGQIHDALNNGYSAVAPSVFREACKRWRETLPVTAARIEAYTFVDVGAGKGRALLLAAELPFRKVVGVELNESLVNIAKQNVALWSRITHSRANIRVVQQNATRFRWPRTPLLVYLNNPFDCTLVEELAGELAAAAAAGSRLIDIIYVNPGCAEIWTCQGIFKLLWNTQIQMDEPDQLADPYEASSDRVAAFRYCATQG